MSSRKRSLTSYVLALPSALWMLGAGTLGLRELCALRLPRAFMAMLLSLVFQISAAFTLHLLGLVPKDILKAMMLYG